MLYSLKSVNAIRTNNSATLPGVFHTHIISFISVWKPNSLKTLIRFYKLKWKISVFPMNYINCLYRYMNSPSYWIPANVYAASVSPWTLKISNLMISYGWRTKHKMSTICVYKITCPVEFSLPIFSFEELVFTILFSSLNLC